MDDFIRCFHLTQWRPADVQQTASVIGELACQATDAGWLAVVPYHILV